MNRKSAPYLLLALLVCLLYNSCKKDKQNNIDALFYSGPWEVSSIRVFNYIGDTQQPTDTLNTDCDLKQIFTFRNDNTCTYTNYSCREQNATGRWSLSRDKLYLISDIVCDTSATGSIKPFENTRIVNLGQYSLVVQTGDLQSNYTPTQRRRIVQYGFIRQKNITAK
jgi:hypothetical protein